MSQHRYFGVWLLILLFLLFSLAVTAQELKQPACADLEQWSAKLQPKNNVQISDKLKLNTSLSDEQIIPLFGRSILTWDNKELGIAYGWLGDCRKAALKAHNKTAGRQLYQAIRSVSNARITLNKMHQMQTYAESKVTSLINYPAVPELQDLLSLAQDALKGKSVQAAARQIKLTGGITLAVIDLQKAPPYLPEKQIEPLIARLAAHREKIAVELQQVASDMANARRSLAEVPMTEAGLEALDRLWQHPVLKRVSRDEADTFRQAVQQKRDEVNRAIQSNRARQMAARRRQQQATTQRSTAMTGQRSSQRPSVPSAQPTAKVDVKAILADILNGDEVEKLTIHGLKPGLDLASSQQQVIRQWRFKQIPVMSITEKKYGSNDSTVEFKEMDDRVGQITFSRYFKRMMFQNTIQEWLQERYGKPDSVKVSAHESMMTWKGGDQRFQAKLSNQLDVFEQSANFQSKMVFALWNSDYGEYMEKQNERCDEIRKLPRNEMSMGQSVWFGAHCPYTAGHHEQPGL